MKATRYLACTIISFVSAIYCVFADSFVETIVDLSARDALVLYNEQIFASNYITGEVYSIDLNGTSSAIFSAGQNGPAGI